MGKYSCNIVKYIINSGQILIDKQMNNYKIDPSYKSIKGIIFDMDNTLYNFFDAKIAACERAAGIIGTGNGQELFRYFLSGKHGFEDPNNIRDYMNDRIE